jgi:hypothetical protein
MNGNLLLVLYKIAFVNAALASFDQLRYLTTPMQHGR